MNSQRIALLLPPSHGLLNGKITESAVKFGELLRAEIEYVPSQAACTRTSFHGKKFARAAEHIPHLRELPGP